MSTSAAMSGDATVCLSLGMLAAADGDVDSESDADRDEC